MKVLTTPTANRAIAAKPAAMARPTCGLRSKRNGTIDGTEPHRKRPPDISMAVMGERSSLSTIPNSMTFMALSRVWSSRLKARTTSGEVFFGDAHVPKQLIQLGEFTVAEVFDVGLLEIDLGFENLALGFGRQVLARGHRDGTGDGAGHAR